MSSLQFSYPQTDLDATTTANYILNRVDKDSSDYQLTIRDAELLHCDETRSTYIANLYKDDEWITTVVCKLGVLKRNLKALRHEATMYRGPLHELQGRVLPRFFGLYEGEMEDEELTGCLITRYNGQHTREPLHGLDWDKKYVQADC